MMRKLGVPDDAWFVTLHVREGSYLAAHGSPDAHNTHRNSNVLDYLEAVQEITARGGWVLRIGHPNTRPIPKMARVIDVAHIDTCSEFDIFLLGTCRFFLGDSSGPVVVASTFGRPAVAANFEMGGGPFQASDLYIPKLYRSLSVKSVLSFERSLAPSLFRPHDAALLAREGVEVIDSSPDEIADLTREMLDRFEGKCAYSPEDDASQDQIFRLFPEGAVRPNSRMGREFLRTYRHLLD